MNSDMLVCEIKTPLSPLHGEEMGGIKGKAGRSGKGATILHVRGNDPMDEAYSSGDGVEKLDRYLLSSQERTRQQCLPHRCDAGQGQ